MKTALTIAGFDPSSGAGVTADLMVFGAHGVFGISCITALTVQTTLGVHRSEAVACELVGETLASLEGDLPPDGIKIGMLGTAGMVEVVTEFLLELRGRGRSVPVVLDPVVRSSSGRELLEARGVEAMRERLLPLVDWVTPNADELALLLGEKDLRREDWEDGARRLRGFAGGQLNVVVTGGDLERPDDLLVAPGGAVHWVAGERIASKATHGTGCAFSSALLCRVVRGETGVEAVGGAKDYVAQAIRRAVPMGGGMGPIDHLWPLRAR